MSKANMVGYVAALLVFTTFWMKTMVPLRTVGIASNVFFIVYGYLAAAYPPLVLHVLLLPLNVLRLWEMLQLTERVEKAASGNLDMAWVKPFMSARHMAAGEILFRKGDPADRLFLVVSGRCRLTESGIEILAGAVVGELALLSPDKTRTQTLQSVEDGDLLEVTYSQVKELYFQNPTFGFYFLELTSRRLFDNIRQLEEEVAELRARLGSGGDQPNTEPA